MAEIGLTGAERYFAARMEDPRYRAAYEANECAVYWCKTTDGRLVEHVATWFAGHKDHALCVALTGAYAGASQPVDGGPDGS